MNIPSYELLPRGCGEAYQLTWKPCDRLFKLDTASIHKANYMHYWQEP
jgi:hypothetical protein